MAGCLFVAMPSRREPFGIVALEGMAAGKAVLATPVGGISEFLPNGINRHVVPERRAWAAALDEMLTAHKEGRLDGKSNQAAAEEYNWSRVAERYLDIYAEARERFGVRRELAAFPGRGLTRPKEK
jgi:glycosyltransferase involved in cell wall biosynthesis